jgi:monoamine oxidase
LDVLVFQKQKVIFDAPALPLSIGDIIALDPESFGISERLRDPVNRESIEDVLQVWSKIEKLAKEIDPRNPWEHPMAEAWDSTTLSTWLAQNAHTALGNWFVQTMNRMGGSGGYEPAQVSLLHALWTQRVSPQREAPETSLLDGGAGQLPELLAQKLPQGTIRLNSPVVKIEQHRPVALPIFRKNTSTSAPHPADAVATITLLGGDQLHARHAVIVACPPHVAGTIIYEPPMPPRREQLTQRAPMGTIIKVLAVFDSPFWLEEGLSGTAMGNLDTLEFVADSTNTLKPGAPGVLASFIVGKAALRHLDLSPRMRRVAIEDDLSKFFSPARIEEHLVDVIEAVWPANQFVGGAFTAFFGPGVWTAYEDALWRPVGRVVWAGTEVSTRWPGYMEGALQAGYDAADEVLEMVKGDRVELKGSVGKSRD